MVTLIEIESQTQRDMEIRVMSFTKRIVKYANELPKTVSNQKISKYLTDLACSVNVKVFLAFGMEESKERFAKVKDLRKKVGEVRFWLGLTQYDNKSFKELRYLMSETVDLMSTFWAHVYNCKQ